jgi:dienelactone hydrolase
MPGPSWCGSDAALDARQSFMTTAALNTWRTDWEGGATLGDIHSGDGFTMRAVRWGHPRTGDQAFGLWLEPSPRPEGPLPLLVNVHGHWDAGVEAGEVLFRSELFARQGWAVLSVATRGAEQGDAPPLPWRTAHFDDGLYGEMRERAFGSTPLAWNVEAAHRGLDLALEGTFSSGPVDRDRVGLIGASGGAEIAALLGAAESRIGASVLAAYEYAFGSQRGSALCSCGVLAGGGELTKASRWLALGACRFGREATARPVLLWDGQPGSGRSAELLGHGLAVDRREVPGVHGFTDVMASASWRWMEGVLPSERQESRTEAQGPSLADEERVRVGTRAAWQHMPAILRPTWPDGMLGVGRVRGTKAPWETPFTVDPQRVRALLGLGTQSEPSAPGTGWVGPLDREALELVRPRSTPDGRAWVVVIGRGPAADGGSSTLSARDVRLDGLPIARLGGLASNSAFAYLTPRGALDAPSEAALTRWGLELGKAPLGLSVHDVMAAHAKLAALPEVDPSKVGFVGIGASGPAALWAARLLGGDSPVFLVHAPATLWWDGPRSPATGVSPVELTPWPTTSLVAGRFGASADPWMALAGMEDRVRWLDPRGGDGGPWKGDVPLPGRLVKTLSEGLED